MGLTMSQRQAVTRQLAHRYQAASKTEKATILDELCQVTGWHRDHARKALRAALTPKPVPPQRKPRDPSYGPEVITALRKAWAVLDAPTGKRLAPFLPEIVDRLVACGELHLSDHTRDQLVRLSAATIDRRLAGDRARWQLRGRSLTKPGSLLKSQIPIRTWADWDDTQPGFVEIDLVGHEGGNPAGHFAQTLTVTDIATGWTENRAVRTKAQKWVLPALSEIIEGFPFPVLGIDSDNGKGSSTPTCSPTAKTGRSPSPGPGPATRTTAPTSSRRTGRWSARPWGTTATAARCRSTYSTGSTPYSAIRSTSLCHNRNSSPKPVPARK
jgi:hypothetical protein